MATFGTVDPATGEEVSGLNFAVPTAVVREFLRAANVEPAEGVTTRLYREALDLEARRHDRKALLLFRRSTPSPWATPT